MTGAESVRIVDYEARHRDAFRDLNLSWIEELFAVEAPDLRQLSDPEATILEPGGAILVAEVGSEAVAVCALVVAGRGHFELAKMATRRDLRGSGVGRKLLHAAIAKARSLGAHKLSLLSHHSLAPALGLYRSMGFVDVALPEDNEYLRADVAMELDLYTPIACSLHDELEALAVRREQVRIRFQDADGGEREVAGTIADIRARGGAEHLRMDDGTTIRLDRLKEVVELRSQRRL